MKEKIKSNPVKDDEDMFAPKGGKKRRQIKSNYRRKTVKKLRSKS